MYFRHYEDVCQNCSVNDVGLLQHKDVLDAFTQIITDPHQDCVATLAALCNNFRVPFLPLKHLAPDTFARQWILVTAEALLLLEVSEWTGNVTLRTYLSQTQFPPSTKGDTFRIPHAFNARNLNKIGGFSIRWTDLLSEHLALEREDIQIAIFHQSHALEFLLAQ